MHTAICAFDDRARAESAVESLVHSGFARHDLHIEHQDLPPSGRHSGTDRWDGMEREVAMDRGRLSSFMQFFTDLFSHQDLRDQIDLYSDHVLAGKYVVVADSLDKPGAERARTLLGGMDDARHLNVLHRPALTPLRDLVARRWDTGTDGSGDTYAGVDASPMQRERALASNRISPSTGPYLRDPELEHAPGLRYADKDKPI